MLGKFLAIVTGIAGLLLGSQAPAFTQNFMQNLEGRVDELRRVVQSIETDRSEIGYSREEATETCAATNEPLFQKDCVRNETILSRFDVLIDLQQKLRNASGWERPILLGRSYAQDDVVREIAVNAVEEYQVAVPVTPEGFGYGAAGGLSIWAVFRLLFGLIGLPFRQRYAY